MYTIFVHEPVNANDFVLKAKVNYFEVQFYVYSNRLFIVKKICVSQNWLKHGKNSVIMNIFSSDIVDMFPEFTAGVGK